MANAVNGGQQPIAVPFTEVQRVVATALVIVGVALIALGALVTIGAILFGGPLITATIIAASSTQVVQTVALTLAGKLALIGTIGACAGSGLAYVGSRIFRY